MRPALVLRDLFTLAAHYRRYFGIWGLVLLGDRVLQRALPLPAYRLIASLTWMRAPRSASQVDFSALLTVVPNAALPPDRFPAIGGIKESAALAVLAHKFNFLGTGQAHWGDPIDWRQDVTSGHRWPGGFYRELLRYSAPAGSDVKVPWELSRFHHFVLLAQTWWLTRDQQYQDAFFEQWEHWSAENSYGYGVNWMNAMEVSIRAVNLLWAAAFLSDAPGWTSERKQAFSRAVTQHGTFIEHNLEVGLQGGQVQAANHYLANIAGLACVGLLATGASARRWRKVGLQALEDEMQRQVLPDGCYFEPSTSYHRLALELFLVPALLARRNGHEMSSAYWRSLEGMMEVILRTTGPDGQVPQLGDNDDGRLLILVGYPDWPRHDHRYLLALGAALFNRADFKAAAGALPEEVFWLLGSDGMEAFEKAPDQELKRLSAAFPDGRLHVLQGKAAGDYALVRSGVPSPQAPTAHAHNDALSLELWMQGAPVFVDPGTACYTPDVDARDRSRSTKSHNTVAVDGQEINLIPEGEPFRLALQSSSWVESWDPQLPEVVAVVEYPVGAGVRLRHQRSVGLDGDTGAWLIRDTLSAPGAHAATWHWHLPKGAWDSAQSSQQEGYFLAGEAKVSVESQPEIHPQITTVPCEHHPAYGASEVTTCVTVQVEWEDAVTLTTRVSSLR